MAPRRLSVGRRPNPRTWSPSREQSADQLASICSTATVEPSRPKQTGFWDSPDQVRLGTSALSSQCFQASRCLYPQRRASLSTVDLGALSSYARLGSARPRGRIGRPLPQIFTELCSQGVENDGLTFLPDTIRVERIRDEEEYDGVRPGPKDTKTS
jgi:hypothetical protein